MEKLIIEAVMGSLKEKRNKLKCNKLSDPLSEDSKQLIIEIRDLEQWLHKREEELGIVRNAENVIDREVGNYKTQTSQAAFILKDHLEKLIKGHEQSRSDYNKRCVIQQEWAQSLQKEAETIEELKCEIDLFERGWKVL